MIRESPQLPAAIRPRDLARCLAVDAALELLDVRSPAEYAAEHVSGSTLMPLDQLDPAAYLHRHRSPGHPVYILCQTGGRARRAIEKFKKAGFESCVLVEGGIEAWIEAGLPVERVPTRVLPLMRQVQIIVGFLSVVGAMLALVLNPWFALIPLMIGGGLLFAGVTGFCGLAVLLARMPWNRSVACPMSSKTCK